MKRILCAVCESNNFRFEVEVQGQKLRLKATCQNEDCAYETSFGLDAKTRSELEDRSGPLPMKRVFDMVG